LPVGFAEGRVTNPRNMDWQLIWKGRAEEWHMAT